jgi:hypothetical protein
VTEGYPVLDSRTSAAREMWAAAVYPPPGKCTLGAMVERAMRAIAAPVVAFVDPFGGRVIVTAEASVKAALLALAPADPTVCTPVAIYGKLATQWNLVSDAQLIPGIADCCLPQLSRRTLAAWLNKALAQAPYAVALVDQVVGTVSLWQDYQRTAGDAAAALSFSGDTVGVEFTPESTPLVFEGGTT